MTVVDAHWRGDAATPRALGSAQVLDIWEKRRNSTMIRRALALLDASLPDVDGDTIVALPIGARDRLLLRLRAACFGSNLECLSACPDCAESVEFSLTIDDLLVSAGADTRREGTVAWEGDEIRLRPVTSRDLLGLEGSGSEEMAIRLLGRCAIGLDDSEKGLSADAVARLSEALAELDPGADIRFSLTCPACGSTWTSVFDIASYLWAEVEMAAQRLLPEVHALASSYGWSEREILALSPARRQSYLALIGAR
jgi:hypothetical protein